MNPIVESIGTLRISIGCRAVDAGARVANVRCNSETVPPESVLYDSERHLVCASVAGISKETRRQKLLFAVEVEGPGTVQWGGVGVAFELSNKGLLGGPSLVVEGDQSAGLSVSVVSAMAVCHAYYARGGDK